MSKVKKAIFNKINNNLKLKEKIILHIFNKYSMKVYKMGFDDAYNWKKFINDKIK